MSVFGWGVFNTAGLLLFSTFVSQISPLHLNTDAWYSFARFEKRAATVKLLKKGQLIRLSLETQLKQKRKTQVWGCHELCGSKIDLISQALTPRQEEWQNTTVYCLFMHRHTHAEASPIVNVYQQCFGETRLPGHQSAKEAEQRRRTPLFHSHPQLPGRGSSVPCNTQEPDLYPAGVWHVHVHACISPCTCNVRTNRSLQCFLLFSSGHKVKRWDECVTLWTCSINSAL